MRRFPGILLLAAVTAGTILTVGQRGMAKQPESLGAVAPLEGEACSPDGRYEIRLEGVGGGVTASGLCPPETVQVVERDSGRILWEDTGFYTQAALWSPDSRYLALARTARTWCQVQVFETDAWTAWDFTLPDGGAIPEYTFLPDDGPWGVWLDEDALELTVGRGGDAGPKKTYRCSLRAEDGQLTGTVLEQTAELLPGSWDFNHDGTPETVELRTLWSPGETGNAPQWYEACIGQDGTLLYREAAGLFHAGENSLFACKLDGRDYLLRYVPYMGQGYCTYAYQLFSLNAAGEQMALRENRVSFDINTGSPGHEFDPAAIAAFLKEVHGYLDGAAPLISTISGEIPIQNVDYSDLSSLEEGLRAFEESL